MEIMPVIYGESTLPESMIFAGGDKNKRRDIIFSVCLVRDGERLVLIDAGCETMPGFVMENFVGTVEALAREGISAEDITDVVITHSHHDHIECVKYFKNATVHIEKDEYESGRKYIPDGFSVNVFSEEFLVTKNIKIVKIGGHSKGSCIVEIKDGDKTRIFAGDECYLRECLTKKIPTGASYCPDASEKFVRDYGGENSHTVILAHDY